MHLKTWFSGFLVGVVLTVVVVTVMNRIRSRDVQTISAPKAQESVRTVPPAELPKAPATQLTPKQAETVATVRALQARRNGKYIPDSDIPAMRRSREQAIDRLLAEFTAARAREYEEEFTRLGLDQESRQKALAYLEGIVRAKLENAQMATSLMRAQNDYEKWMKNLLGSRYAEYEAYENGSRARAETQRLSDFIQQNNGTPLPDSVSATLADLIAKSRAYSPETIADIARMGVFDSVPQPAAGDAARAAFESTLKEIQATAAALLAEARSAGVDSRTLEMLEQYYGGKMASYNELIDSAKDPLAGAIRRLEQQLATLQRSPNPDSKRIAAMQNQLTMLREQRARGLQP